MAVRAFAAMKGPQLELGEKVGELGGIVGHALVTGQYGPLPRDRW